METRSATVKAMASLWEAPVVDNLAGMPSASAATAQRQTRVLVADDNHPLAMIMTWAIEAKGYDVRTCANGREAVDLASSFHPDIVLMDIGMPVMNGLEACRVMRDTPDLQAMLIIAHSAWGDQDMRRQTQAAGFDIHLVKPANLDEIESLMSGSTRQEQ